MDFTTLADYFVVVVLVACLVVGYIIKTSFEEYSHLHIMYKYMKNNDVKISDTLEKRYKLAEEKLMQL